MAYNMILIWIIFLINFAIQINKNGHNNRKKKQLIINKRIRTIISKLKKTNYLYFQQNDVFTANLNLVI